MRDLTTLKRELEQCLADTAVKLRNDISARRLSDVVAVRRDGDVTREFDRYSEKEILRVFEKFQFPVTIISEESPPRQIGTTSEFIAFIDPLDGSHLAARAYPLCAIAVSIVDLQSNTPVLSLIQDIFTGNQYCAVGNSASRNGCSIEPAHTTCLEDSFLVSYMASPSRIACLPSAQILYRRVGLFLNYGGPLDIARVGAGDVDIFIEHAKGFALHDFLPGAHIACAAGAVLSDLFGNPITLYEEGRARMRFLISCSPALHEEALRIIEEADLAL